MDLINIKDISFKYADYILKNISLDIQQGYFVSLLGVNGAGKSTLLKNINKLLHPESGSIYLNGRDIDHMRHTALAKNMSYVSQYNEAPKNTVFDTILIGRVPYISGKAQDDDYEKVENLIRRLKLEKYALRDTRSLSGGEFQKVVIARALAQEPQVILLDEPTSNLDIKNQVDVMALIKEYCQEKGISVLISIHDINLSLQFSDKYIMLKNGEVFKYGGRNIITPENLKSIYGLDVDVVDYKNRKVMLLN